MRLTRFARARLLSQALPISLLILRKKPTVLQSNLLSTFFKSSFSFFFFDRRIYESVNIFSLLLSRLQGYPSYKITKIVRALSLAESSVCMRVCKHGCGVKLFGFSRADDASTKFEKVFEFKTRQVYFIYPFLRRLKHGKSLQRR